MTLPESAPPADGRRARRARGRAAVVEATIDLVLEGFSPPTVEQVAERAGVSTASVFRYFDTLDELRDETIRRYFERFAHLHEIPDIGVGRLDERVKRFVDIRHQLYADTAPMARLVRNRAAKVDALHDILHRHRTVNAEQIGHHFATELEGLGPALRGELIGTIATLTSFEAWSELTEDHRRTPTQVRRGWTRALLQILRPAE
ncbi:MAG: TetR/AcrR family transcriptional regulator [Actinomycetota bacterium]